MVGGVSHPVRTPPPTFPNGPGCSSLQTTRRMSPDGGEEAVAVEMAAGTEVGMVPETPQAAQVVEQVPGCRACPFAAVFFACVFVYL